jgi:DNA-binding transcriptional MerR regulator
MYNEKDIENLRMIHHLLKERGYTIQGARQKIKENRQETLNEAELVARLRYVRSELEKIKSKL